MQTVLLTGGTGYLGSKLAGALLGAGHRVVVLKRPSSSLARLTHLLGRIELRDAEDPPGDLRADAVLHCATDYGRAGRGPEPVVRANVSVSPAPSRSGRKCCLPTSRRRRSTSSRRQQSSVRCGHLSRTA